MSDRFFQALALQQRQRTGACVACESEQGQLQGRRPLCKSCYGLLLTMRDARKFYGNVEASISDLQNFLADD